VLTIFCENQAEGDAFLDDFRFHPVSASMTNYVYNTFTGLPEYTINSDGFYTRIVYDAMGRVSQTFVETPIGEKKVTESSQNFYRLSTPTPDPFQY
jgi:hypothetical protein